MDEHQGALSPTKMYIQGLQGRGRHLPQNRYHPQSARIPVQAQTPEFGHDLLGKSDGVTDYEFFNVDCIVPSEILCNFAVELCYNAIVMNGVAPHIVQYQGSKRMLAPQILRYMPRRFERLVEPFAGMAAITIAVARQERAEKYVINDLNKPLVGVLQSAIETPTKLVSDYTNVWNDQFSYEQGCVEHFYKVRSDFNNGNQSPANMLYLLARCVKGSVRYGSNGLFNQSPDKRRNGTSPKTLKLNVDAISYYLKGRTDFLSLDYREVLEMTRPGDIVYMDPPYQGVSNVRDNRYYSGIEFGEFVKAIDRLNSRGVDFLISYDGKCGDKQYGEDLPDELGLQKIMLRAGLSSQSILLGKKEVTYEALYVSRGLQQDRNSAKSSSHSLATRLRITIV